MMKICIVAGARPNFVKIAPLARALDRARADGKELAYRIVYTGPADDAGLDASLFADLDMREPDAFLGVRQGAFAPWTAGIMVAFANELQAHPAHVVVVVDDLTPTMACAIVAKKQGAQVAHLVAGTRSFDLNRPKEVNSLITDGLADYLFTAGMGANRNLNQTGTENERMFLVGNILIDSLRHNHARFLRPACFNILGLQPNHYILLTLNRRALIGKADTLRTLMHTLTDECRHLPIVAPLHTYVRERLMELDIQAPNLHLLPPQSYLNFGYLEAHAKAIVTDSGNVAEEATFLGVPCMTLNSYAEHPETITIGTNELVDEDARLLQEALLRLNAGTWKKGALPERWDGRTADRIVQTLIEQQASSSQPHA